MKHPIIFLYLLSTTLIFAQNNNSTTIYFKDGSTKQFEKVKFENNAEDYIIGVEVKNADDNKTIYHLTDIVSVKENTTKHVTKQYKKNLYLLEEVIVGSLSLYKSGAHYFLENDENGLREISKVIIDQTTLNRYDYATLSIFVNKCKAAQEKAYNKNNSISISVLKSVVNTYNSCNLSEDIQFAENVITLANAPSEFIEVGINVGYGFLNTKFDDLSPGVSNQYGTPVIGAQVYFNTNILEKRLSFLFLVDYSLPKEFKSNDNKINLKTKLSYVHAMLGTRYTFNNINKAFSPYVGLNGGLILSNMSDITFQPAIYGAQKIGYKSKYKLSFNLNAGTYIHLGNKKIDFNIMYQPENEIQIISNDNLTTIENNYKLSGFQLKATYVF